MGDRVTALKKDKMQQFTSPIDVYDRSATRSSRASSDRLAALHDAKLATVTVGLRPEHLELSDGGRVEVVVDLIEDLGSEAYLYTHAKDASSWSTGASTGCREADRYRAAAQACRRCGAFVRSGDRRTGRRVGQLLSASWGVAGFRFATRGRPWSACPRVSPSRIFRTSSTWFDGGICQPSAAL